MECDSIVLPMMESDFTIHSKDVPTSTADKNKIRHKLFYSNDVSFSFLTHSLLPFTTIIIYVSCPVFRQIYSP